LKSKNHNKFRSYYNKTNKMLSTTTRRKKPHEYRATQKDEMPSYDETPARIPRPKDKYRTIHYPEILSIGSLRS
jgi:hypothetical protein